MRGKGQERRVLQVQVRIGKDDVDGFVWRIVQDEQMRVPEGASPVSHDDPDAV